MRAPRKQLASVIAAKTLDGSFGSADVTSLAAYLLDEGRTGELSSLLRDVQKDWADRGIVEVVAYSAHELSAAVKTDLEAEVRKIFPHAARIIVTSKLDPSLIGGVRLEFTDHRLDLSTRGKLQKFKALAFQGKE
jgi:F0F1-type ATP synthase delta subunit